MSDTPIYDRLKRQQEITEAWIEMSRALQAELERERCHQCGERPDDLYDHRIGVHGWGKEDN